MTTFLPPYWTSNGDGTWNQSGGPPGSYRGLTDSNYNPITTRPKYGSGSGNGSGSGSGSCGNGCDNICDFTQILERLDSLERRLDSTPGSKRLGYPTICEGIPKGRGTRIVQRDSEGLNAADRMQIKHEFSRRITTLEKEITSIRFSISDLTYTVNHVKDMVAKIQKIQEEFNSNKNSEKSDYAIRFLDKDTRADSNDQVPELKDTEIGEIPKIAETAETDLTLNRAYV